jgi:hypothetical protein
MEKKNTVNFEDLPLATWLVVAGHPMLKSPTPNPQRHNNLVFTFERTEKLEKDILAYHNKTASSDPLTLFTMFRQLKAYSLPFKRPYSEGENHGNRKE